MFIVDHQSHPNLQFQTPELRDNLCNKNIIVDNSSSSINSSNNKNNSNSNKNSSKNNNNNKRNSYQTRNTYMQQNDSNTSLGDFQTPTILPHSEQDTTMELPPLQKLSLDGALPSSDIKNFTFICSFLSHILNLRDPVQILEKVKDTNFYNSIQYPDGYDEILKIEIMKNIVFPFDTWLRDEVSVKDIKIKIILLNEINTMMELELQTADDQTSFEEITLNYYAKLLTAYKMYDMPARSTYLFNTATTTAGNNTSSTSSNTNNSHSTNNNNNNNSTFALGSANIIDESIDERFEHVGDLRSTNDSEFNYLGKPLYRTNSNLSQKSQGSSTQNRRASTSSSLSRRRFSSLLNVGSNQNKHGSDSSLENDTNAPLSKQISSPHTPPQRPFLQFNFNHHLSSSSSSGANSDANLNGNFNTHSNAFVNGNGSPTMKSSRPTLHDGNSTTFNSILSKLKIYTRMKKHRELNASLGSNLSQQTQPSNRSSISTTQTGQTSVGTRRRSMGLGISHPNQSNTSASSSFVSTNTLVMATPPPPTLLPQLNREENIATSEQRHENAKNKYDYYIQLFKLEKNSQRILKILNNLHTINNKLLKFIEFIKSKLLKFIVIDIMCMILGYAELQSSNFQNVRRF